MGKLDDVEPGPGSVLRRVQEGFLEAALIIDRTPQGFSAVVEKS